MRGLHFFMQCKCLLPLLLLREDSNYSHGHKRLKVSEECKQVFEQMACDVVHLENTVSVAPRDCSFAALKFALNLPYTGQN